MYKTLVSIEKKAKNIKGAKKFGDLLEKLRKNIKKLTSDPKHVDNSHKELQISVFLEKLLFVIQNPIEYTASPIEETAKIPRKDHAGHNIIKVLKL